MGITADRIKDIGPQPQSFDIERATKENTNYRSVAWSGRYLQVTLMSIPAGTRTHHPSETFFSKVSLSFAAPICTRPLPESRRRNLSLIHI